MGRAVKKPALGLRVGVRLNFPDEFTRFGTVIEHLSTQFVILDQDENVWIHFYADDWFNAEGELL